MEADEVDASEVEASEVEASEVDCVAQVSDTGGEAECSVLGSDVKG